MAHQVRTLVAGLSLPDDRYYPNANTVVTLTDEEFADIDPAVFSSGKLADLGPDPEAVLVEGQNGLASIRLCGRLGAAGAPTTGAWLTGDAVLDSANAWHYCTAGGTPGTWT